MKEFLKTVLNCKLFEGIVEEEASMLLGCLSAKVEQYEKEEALLLQGGKVDKIGILLAGKLQILREDYDGNRSIVSELVPSEVFAEAFVCAGLSHSPVTVLAIQNATVMYIDYRKLITTCPGGCDFHHKLVENMISLIAHKNVELSKKLQILSCRSTREKILTYLTHQSERWGSLSFAIPFTREQLADYLSVNRSALSREISVMAAEGLLSYERNIFTLYKLHEG